jgi:FkbH-like protein
VASISGVYLVASAELSRLYPVAKYHDQHADRLGHIPYTRAFFTALGTMIARRIYALRHPPRKVIVLDCDQTLWQGVCGEDGAHGITLDPPRQHLQAFLVAQHEAGMLLCLCSKNNPADVFEVFERRPEMPLRREHIAAWRINWRPKSENIKELAHELGLGLDSFIFIDDNPVECAEVQANCPEVLILTLPAEPAKIPRFLDHVWAFDHLKVTAADRARTAAYRRHADRERLRETSLTFEDFLAGLELEVEISAMLPEQVARVAQLTQRTNQLNVYPARRGESEIRHLVQSGALECWVVSARDRFGDYGLVGAMLFKTGSEAIEVETFLLSCRALGRRIERRMLAQLERLAQARGLAYVVVPYLPPPKNKPALDFLTSAGAAVREPSDGGWVFRFPVESPATVAQHTVLIEV